MDNIKINLKDLEYESLCRFRMAQDGDQLWASSEKLSQTGTACFPTAVMCAQIFRIKTNVNSSDLNLLSSPTNFLM